VIHKQDKQTQQPKQHKRPVKSAVVGDAASVYGVYGAYEGAVHYQRRLTAAETERVQVLISQGMSPKLARAEVLGEEV
jgi:hypothetical protein